MLQRLKNLFHLLIAIAVTAINGFPAKRLKIIAITGTDGKTTTSTLLYHILQSSGKKVALISTVAAYIDDEEVDTGFHVTTPSSASLQRMLLKIANLGIEYVILEITSHSIDQKRIWNIHPIVSGITNVTHEHLDYHKTFEAYLKTKATLLIQSEYGLINKDAKESFDKLNTYLSEKKALFSPYTTSDVPKTVKTAMKKRFMDEEYNIENATLAYMISTYIKIPQNQIIEGILHFKGVKGRMEYIQLPKAPTVIIDFAHTPNALERLLTTVRIKMKNEAVAGSKLIVIFGCAGLRDRTKRPKMAEIATRLADYAIFTAEDPRTEDVWSIINQMKSGVKYHSKEISIADRYDAIQFGLTSLATSKDTVIIAGKGHEKSMCYGNVEFPWSDAETAMKILKKETKKK